MTDAPSSQPVVLGASTTGMVIGFPDQIGAALPGGVVAVKDGTTLTDEDLRALGLIIANWALAEQMLKVAIGALCLHPDVAATTLPTENISAFRRKCEAWNKAVRLACAKHPEMVEIGIFLSGRGAQLATNRDQAAHWPASRAVAQPDGKAHFSDLNMTIAFDPQSLMQLAADIQVWGQMVTIYMLTAIFVLQLPGIKGEGGPPPLGVFWQQVLTYRKTHRPHVHARKRRPTT